MDLMGRKPKKNLFCSVSTVKLVVLFCATLLFVISNGKGIFFWNQMMMMITVHSSSGKWASNICRFTGFVITFSFFCTEIASNKFREIWNGREIVDRVEGVEEKRTLGLNCLHFILPVLHFA